MSLPQLLQCCSAFCCSAASPELPHHWQLVSSKLQGLFRQLMLQIYPHLLFLLDGPHSLCICESRSPARPGRQGLATWEGRESHGEWVVHELPVTGRMLQVWGVLWDALWDPGGKLGTQDVGNQCFASITGTSWPLTHIPILHTLCCSPCSPCLLQCCTAGLLSIREG